MSDETDAATLLARVESQAGHTHTRCEGLAMAWRSWGSGTPLVLLHGAAGSWTHWIRNILPLARKFRVLAPDLPGFGDSATPPEPHSAEVLVRHLLAGLDELVPAPARIELAGFSLGGIIAGLVAARLQRRVRTLALLGPNGMALARAATPPLARIAAGIPADHIERAQRRNLEILMLADPAAVDALALRLQTENLRRARFKAGAIPSSDLLAKALPAIEAKIVGIWGEKDAYVGDRMAERRGILGTAQPGSAFHVIRGAGHWANYEAAETVNAILLDAFAEA